MDKDLIDSESKSNNTADRNCFIEAPEYLSANHVHEIEEGHLAPDVKNVINFLEIMYKLKHSPRKGWEIRNIENPERIAGHMYAMGIMTFLLGNDSNLDRLKCMQLALVHDLPECIVGDITPLDGVPTEQKHQLEQDAIEKLGSMLGGVPGTIICDLYNEYRAQITPEAKFVKDLDKFDMIFTAALYEKQWKMPNGLQEFFDCTEGKFEHPLVQKLVKGLLEYRANVVSR